MKSVFPHSSPDTGEETVTVIGAGLSPRLKCTLEKSGLKYDLSYVKGKKNNFDLLHM